MQEKKKKKKILDWDNDAQGKHTSGNTGSEQGW